MTGTSSPPLSAESRLKVIATALLCVVVTIHVYDVSVGGLTDRSGRMKAPDFLQFYTYGTLVLDGRVASLYDADAHARAAAERVDPRLRLTDFVPDYSPLIAALSAPLARLPYVESMACFTLLSALLYVGAVAWLGRHSLRLRDHAVTVGVIALAWPTLFTVLRYGQISSLTLVLWSFATACGLARRDLTAGIVLGLVAYKPNLLIVPGTVWLLSREWRLVAGLACGALAELALDAVIAGVAPMQRYIETLASLAVHPSPVHLFPWESHSIGGFITLLVPATPGSVAALAGAVLGIALGYRAWSATGDGRLRWAGISLAAIAGSPHLLTYDLLLLAVPLLLVADAWLDARDVPRRDWWLLAVLYFGAVPGALVARLVHVQLSTVAMALLLWAIGQRGERPDAGATALSSSRPSISS